VRKTASHTGNFSRQAHRAAIGNSAPSPNTTDRTNSQHHCFLRLRLPLPLALENVTVCEEPLMTTRTRPDISYSLL